MIYYNLEKLDEKKRYAILIRERRANVCFPVINRGKLWYDSLTREQLNELKIWYKAWLDAPETLSIPASPTWLNDKPIEEDVL